MGNTNEVITIEDVHQLVDAKNRDPKIAPEDLYRQVDRVKANYSTEMWKLLWIPLCLAISAMFGMLFFKEKNGFCVWHRLSIIGFIIASFWGGSLLKKFDRTWWWILILDVVILYIIFVDELSFIEIVHYIAELL